MAIKPADRLLSVIALAALGTAAAARLGIGGNWRAPAGESLQLTVQAAGEDGLSPEDLETLVAGYPFHSENSTRYGQGPAAPDTARVNVTINTKNAPADILIAGDQSLTEGIEAGLYLPLDYQDFLQESLPESPAFPVSSAFSAAGTWALPLVSAMDVLVYNIPLLREAGFDRPPRTRSDFLFYARTIKTQGEKNRPPDGGKTGRYGFALGLSPQDPRGLGRDIYPWFYSSGLPLVKDGKPEFGGRDYTETLEFLFTLNREGLIMPGSFDTTGADRIQDFVQGDVAMIIVSTRELRSIREKTEDGAIGITLIPHADSYTGKPVIGLSTWYAGISAASPHPGQARTLLQHLREQSGLLAETLTLVPGAGGYSPYIAVDPLLDKAWGMYEAAIPIPNRSPGQNSSPYPGQTPSPDQTFYHEITWLFHPDSPITAEEAAQTIRQSWGQWNEPENL
ncbi:MAG: extracellular solute-binding protein [Treponema sp.]|jgi:ABC-type glycerol-3-phosphate transport system substrate-binding protein|nr:extracellular solute-binding protein [Treponema sp.]